jgi:hypothetical protein
LLALHGEPEQRPIDPKIGPTLKIPRMDHKVALRQCYMQWRSWSIITPRG